MYYIYFRNFVYRYHQDFHTIVGALAMAEMKGMDSQVYHEPTGTMLASYNYFNGVRMYATDVE